eukprot:CAMPEP_0170562414 /NCGR_PEP_ID=MMETSP0211-20121228/60363_1 /TAXON_ID=311385 /ORGANISM="Pseudokeronopsis sp., Strain OXSARD2" /LENGTH=128 /DNA_ID=CAMNT_0010879249 /DNA_START=112 /DNA_END=498 /DNA_ORIENTATION=-
MIATPTVEFDAYNPNKSAYEESLYVGEKKFRFTSTNRERVMEQEEKNKFLDGSPTQIHIGQTREQIMKLRPRDKDKEIGPPSFRYQAQSSVDRVFESLMNKTTGNLAKSNLGQKQFLSRKVYGLSQVE